VAGAAVSFIGFGLPAFLIIIIGTVPSILPIIMPNLTTFTFVCIGGALGSLLRWWLGSALNERYTGKFPLGTFVINVSGAFVMGLLSTLMGIDW
jgi:hypothetical protein